MQSLVVLFMGSLLTSLQALHRRQKLMSTLVYVLRVVQKISNQTCELPANDGMPKPHKTTPKLSPALQEDASHLPPSPHVKF